MFVEKCMQLKIFAFGRTVTSYYRDHNWFHHHTNFILFKLRPKCYNTLLHHKQIFLIAIRIFVETTYTRSNICFPNNSNLII